MKPRLAYGARHTIVRICFIRIPSVVAVYATLQERLRLERRRLRLRRLLRSWFGGLHFALPCFDPSLLADLAAICSARPSLIRLVSVEAPRTPPPAEHDIPVFQPLRRVFLRALQKVFPMILPVMLATMVFTIKGILMRAFLVVTEEEVGLFLAMNRIKVTLEIEGPLKGVRGAFRDTAFIHDFAFFTTRR